MAVEYAAMSVLQSEEATIFKDRLQLVQEFNFLVLPGSGQYKADTKAKARIYNHEVVAAIASGRDTSNLKEQMDLLACFSMKTDSTHEHLFKKIAHVPLRLL
jgi:sporulation-control protein spo0M